MLKTVLPYPKKWINWLIQLSLWWSVFCFSGHIPSEFLTLSTPPQTELVVTKVVLKKLISFQNNTINLFIDKTSNYSFLRIQASLFAYNQLVRTKYFAYIKKGYQFNFSTILLPLKFLPQATKEASFTYLLG